MFTSYTVALFLHVCGAFGLAIGFCGAFFGMLTWRRVQDVAQIHSIGKLLNKLDPLAIVGGLLVLFTGFFMAKQDFTFTTGWIDVALGSFVLLGALNGAIVMRQRRAIMTLAGQAPAGPLPAAITQHIRQPILGVGLAMQLWLLVAVVFLMTIQPDLPLALGAVAVALVAGGGTGMLWRGPAVSTSQVASSAQ
jgi:hypothetical protein